MNEENEAPYSVRSWRREIKVKRMSVLRSAQFDDIYFSPEDGLAEKRHVFISGNNLPATWAERDVFTIAETGFGAGLNFMAAWTLFEKSARAEQRMHYVSFEKYPLSWDEISRALAPWRTDFGGRLDRLRGLYPLRVPGFHRVILSEQVVLTLIFDDVNAALPQLDAPRGVDAWFLDGFAPAKNPEMWSDGLFAEMARLSHAGTSFATFTVASAVRRKLAAAGFKAEKVKGFGRKNEMLRGVFEGVPCGVQERSVKKVAIVGGGLAGTAAAFVMKRRGLQPVIFEKEAALAAGASGNALGLYNPRLSAQRTAESDFYAASFAQAVRTLGELQRGHDIDFNPCGSLHLFIDAEKEKRLRGADENGGWHKSHMHVMDARAASQRAGVGVGLSALCLPDSGTVSPSALCRAYADGVEVRLSAAPDIEKLPAEFDAVILACGAAVREFCDIPVHTVRGQVTCVKSTLASQPLRGNLCFGGYLSPQLNGMHMLGATFQKWLDHSDVTDEDHKDNLARLRQYFPALADGMAVEGGRAALRTSSKDRFPVIGHIANNVYVSTAHGSHGIISALAAAHLIADMMTDAPRSLPRDTISALSPARFAAREDRKNKSS